MDGPVESPNVLLVVLDSVRARNTSLHGHENETTPFLEDLATESVVFDEARAPGTWSLPSHASMFTGLHVDEHGMSDPTDRLEPGHSVFEQLAADGYTTGVFSENPFITVSETGLVDGFDTVEGPRNVPFSDALDPTDFVQREGQGQYRAFLEACLSHDRPLRSLANGALVKLAWDYPQFVPDRLEPSTAADVYVDLFLDWERQRTGPWAACINLMDAHLPYTPDSEYDLWGDSTLTQLQHEMDDQVWEFVGGQRQWWQRKALEALYDGTIRQMDAELHRLVDALRRRGSLDDTLLVVTADHGECFGERSHVQPARLAGHGPGIDETLLHVPLVVRPPNGADGERVDTPASLTYLPAAIERTRSGDDVTSALTRDPTVVSYHGLPDSARVRAEKYADEGTLYDLDGVSRAVYVDDEDIGIRKHAAWRDRGATVRLFDARTSSLLDDTDRGVVEETFAPITDRGVRSDESSTIDGATEERLKDLGYM